MKKLSVLVIIILLSLTLAPISLAAEPRQMPGSSGEGAAGPGAALYDPKTVETVSGLVVAVSPATLKEGGLPQRMHLTLKTQAGTLEVFLGPSSFIQQLGLKVANLNRLQVTGSRMTLEGKPALIAAEVKKGDQVFRLRDENGNPLWMGQKRPSPAPPPSRKVYPQGQGLYWPGRPDNR